MHYGLSRASLAGDAASGSMVCLYCCARAGKSSNGGINSAAYSPLIQAGKQSACLFLTIIKSTAGIKNPAKKLAQ